MVNKKNRFYSLPVSLDLWETKKKPAKGKRFVSFCVWVDRIPLYLTQYYWFALKHKTLVIQPLLRVQRTVYDVQMSRARTRFRHVDDFGLDVPRRSQSDPRRTCSEWRRVWKLQKPTTSANRLKTVSITSALPFDYVLVVTRQFGRLWSTNS